MGEIVDVPNLPEKDAERILEIYYDWVKIRTKDRSLERTFWEMMGKGAKEYIVPVKNILNIAARIMRLDEVKEEKAVLGDVIGDLLTAFELIELDEKGQRAFTFVKNAVNQKKEKIIQQSEKAIREKKGAEDAAQVIVATAEGKGFHPDYFCSFMDIGGYKTPIEPKNVWSDDLIKVLEMMKDSKGLKPDTRERRKNDDLNKKIESLEFENGEFTGILPEMVRDIAGYRVIKESDPLFQIVSRLRSNPEDMQRVLGDVMQFNFKGANYEVFMNFWKKLQILGYTLDPRLTGHFINKLMEIDAESRKNKQEKDAAADGDQKQFHKALEEGERMHYDPKYLSGQRRMDFQLALANIARGMIIDALDKTGDKRIKTVFQSKYAQTNWAKGTYTINHGLQMLRSREQQGTQAGLMRPGRVDRDRYDADPSIRPLPSINGEVLLRGIVRKIKNEMVLQSVQAGDLGRLYKTAEEMERALTGGDPAELEKIRSEAPAFYNIVVKTVGIINQTGILDQLKNREVIINLDLSIALWKLDRNLWKELIDREVRQYLGPLAGKAQFKGKMANTLGGQGEILYDSVKKSTAELLFDKARILGSAHLISVVGETTCRISCAGCSFDVPKVLIINELKMLRQVQGEEQRKIFQTIDEASQGSDDPGFKRKMKAEWGMRENGEAIGS